MPMLRWIGTVFLLSLISVPTLGQTRAKVQKVKGRKAIIILPSDHDLQKGDRLTLFQGRRDRESGSTNGARRKYSVNGSVSYAQTDTEIKTSLTTSKTQSTSLSVIGSFGWNTGDMEYGPEVSLATIEVSGDQTSQYALGGFYHYHFSPNKPGTEMVPYAGGSLAFHSQKLNNQSLSGFGFRGEGGVKYFPIRDDFAVDASLGYDMTSVSGNIDYTVSGISLIAGITTYF